MTTSRIGDRLFEQKGLGRPINDPKEARGPGKKVPDRNTPWASAYDPTTGITTTRVGDKVFRQRDLGRPASDPSEARNNL